MDHKSTWAKISLSPEGQTGSRGRVRRGHVPRARLSVCVSVCLRVPAGAETAVPVGAPGSCEDDNRKWPGEGFPGKLWILPDVSCGGLEGVDVRPTSGRDEESEESGPPSPRASASPPPGTHVTALRERRTPDVTPPTDPQRRGLSSGPSVSGILTFNQHRHPACQEPLLPTEPPLGTRGGGHRAGGRRGAAGWGLPVWMDTCVLDSAFSPPKKQETDSIRETHSPFFFLSTTREKKPPT